MKIHRSILAVFGLLALTAGSALALTIPVAEDTSANGSGTKLTPAAGKAAQLTVSNPQGAYLRFDLSNLPASINAANITSARLHIYVNKAAKPDDLGLFDVTSDWHETDNGPVPTLAMGNFGFIASSDVVGKKFLSVDVTASIVSALSGGSNFGFAIFSANGKKIILGSKEGPATGFPAYLDIESNAEIDGMGTATFNSIVSNSSIFAGGNVTAAATGLFGDNLILDTNGTSDGSFAGSALVFGGGASGEGIASGRTGGNQFGLDFYTAGTARLSIDNSGNVGIGTSTPTAKLDVRGDVKLGSTGQLFAPGGQENLRFVRGAIGGGGTPAVLAGAGFTVARTAGAPTGDYTITWTTPFTGNPTATVSPIAGVAAVTANVFSIGSNSMRVQIYVGASLSDQNWNFIAVGPR